MMALSVGKRLRNRGGEKRLQKKLLCSHDAAINFAARCALKPRCTLKRRTLKHSNDRKNGRQAAIAPAPAAAPHRYKAKIKLTIKTRLK
jgi:hypothetical protein